MTTYFNPLSPADTNLLRPERRTYTDLANLAAEVEKDCIEEYTYEKPTGWFTALWMYPAAYGVSVGNPTNRLYVGLRGYTVDAADSTVDPDLKDALKRAIAHVVDWRIGQRIREEALASSGVAGVSRTYLEESRNLFPRGWDRSLRRFDIRTPVWGI